MLRLLSLIALVSLSSGALQGVRLHGCDQLPSGHVKVSWEASANGAADYYELQVAYERDGQTAGIFSTAATEAELDFLLPGKSYWLRVRAHAAGEASLGPGTWSDVGEPMLCKVGAQQLAGAKSHRHVGVKTIEALRESEFTYDVDYLMNHNSGDIEGDATFLTLSSNGTSKESFVNVTFENATFTLFCVDMMVTTIPDTYTTGGDTSFSDFVSCNDNGKPSDPQCMCDNWIDRTIGGLNPDHGCATAAGTPCERRTWLKDCVCNCTQASLDYSARYVGMMPVYALPKHPDPLKRPERLGSWFSTPKATECAEHEEIGASRPDGTVCTWKRRPSARVIRGWHILDAGWNTTHGESIDAAQVRHNAGVIRKYVAEQQFAPWRCDTTDSNSFQTSPSIVV